MSTTSKETAGDHDQCLNCESVEETSSCTCSSFGGFEGNPGFDHSSSGSGQIVEEDSEPEEERFGINHTGPLDPIREDCESSVFSLDIDNIRDVVYVAVDCGNSSMKALSWTLVNFVKAFTIVRLIHVFPVLRLVPNPLGAGKVLRTHVSPVYVNQYLTEEKGKRKQQLRRCIDLGVNSEVNAEMELIEGDNVANAIVDLVNKRGIRKLVVGITQSDLSETGSAKPKAVADEVAKNAPETCDVKIICEGREVFDQIITRVSSRSSDSSSSQSSPRENNARAIFARFVRSISNMNKDRR